LQLLRKTIPLRGQFLVGAHHPVIAGRRGKKPGALGAPQDFSKFFNVL